MEFGKKNKREKAKKITLKNPLFLAAEQCPIKDLIIC
jgi:hypothetical protein